MDFRHFIVTAFGGFVVDLFGALYLYELNKQKEYK